MRQHFRKILSALVALTLVLLVLPALSGHAANAETIINVAMITGIDAPKAGETPDYTVANNSAWNFTISGEASASWKNGIRWDDVTTGNTIKTSDVFLSGHQYSVLIILKPKSGYAFNPEGVYGVDGNFNTSYSIRSDGALSLTYTFSKIPTPSGFVDKAMVGIAAPKAGEKPSFTLSSLTPADKLSLHRVVWTDLATGKELAADDRFLSGHQYKVRVEIYAKSGYCFGANFWDAASSGYINGYAAEMAQYANTHIGLTYTFPKLATPANFISSVAVTGVTAPAVGAKPSYSYSVSTAHTQKCNTTGTNNTGVTWIDSTGDGWTAMNASDTFQSGHEYTVIVYVDAESGYNFGANYWDMANTGTVNGNAAEVSNADTTRTRLYYEFPALSAKPVTGTAITKLDAPAVGKTPDYDVYLTSSGFYRDSISNGYWENGVIWFDDTANNALTPTDTFKAGHVYRVRVSLYVANGYTAVDASGKVTATATINGNAATVGIKWNNTNIGFDYTFPALAAEAPKAVIKDIVEPIAGANPSFSVSVEGEGLAIEDYNEGAWNHGLRWYDLTDSKNVKPSDTFIAGHEYQVLVSVLCGENTMFTRESKASINGYTATLDDLYDVSGGEDNNAVFSYTFIKARQVLPEIAINVSAPTAGAAPSYEFTVTPAECKPSLTLGGFKDGIAWSSVKGEASTVLDPGEAIPADADKAFFTMAIMAPDGYRFTNTAGELATVVKVNGNAVTKNVTAMDGLMTVVYYFDLGESAHLFPVDFYGFAEYGGGLFYVYKGDVVTDANGVIMDPNNPSVWYFCANGQAQLQHTGIASYDGQFFYVVNGVLDTTKSCIIEYDGQSFIIAAGRILIEYSGLIQDPSTGVWYFVAEGRVLKEYTGLQLYDGAWFYVVNGRLASEYTGPVVYDGSTFNVVNGQVA